MANKKKFETAIKAVTGIKDGSIIMISGFGDAGNPTELIHALIEQGAKNLTIVSNNAGTGYLGLAKLLKAGRVKKIICSFPRSAKSVIFQDLHSRDKIDLEIVPQGTLAERIRAGGAGIGGFFTPTAAGTKLSQGKEARLINGREYVFEHPIHADISLIKAHQSDEWGNLLYNKAARNFAPAMCMAAKITIVQVRKITPLGSINPEHVTTPSLFVDRIVQIPNPISEASVLLNEPSL